MKQLTLLLVIFFITIGCNTDEGSDNTLSCQSINTDDLSFSTGVSFYDINGASIGQYGIANDRSLIETDFVVFPNPASDQITLSTTDLIRAMWVYEIDCPLACEDLDNITESYNPDLYEGQEEYLQLNERIIGNFSGFIQTVRIRTTSLDNGSYRVVLRLNSGAYHWQNIIIHKELEDIPEIIEFIESGC